MSTRALNPTPLPRTVVWEQFRCVGLAVRREAVATAAILVGVTLLAIILSTIDGGEVEVWDITPVPGQSLLVAAAALFFPMVVWKAERRFGASHLWTLPVDHRRHALAKVAGGWAWLMIFVATSLLWLFITGLLVGADLGAPEPRWVMGDVAGTVSTGGPAGAHEVAWVTPAWQWLVPFAAATFVYLLSSALTLATDHPWRWLAATALTFVTLILLVELGDVTWIESVFHFMEPVFTGRYGLDMVLRSGHGVLVSYDAVPSGEHVAIWRSLPDFGTWSVATLLWEGLAVAGLSASALRHREQ